MINIKLLLLLFLQPQILLQPPPLLLQLSLALLLWLLSSQLRAFFSQHTQKVWQVSLCVSVIIKLTVIYLRSLQSFLHSTHSPDHIQVKLAQGFKSQTLFFFFFSYPNEHAQTHTLTHSQTCTRWKMAPFICAPGARGSPRKSVRSFEVHSVALLYKEPSYSLTSTFTHWQRASQYKVSLIECVVLFNFLRLNSVKEKSLERNLKYVLLTTTAVHCSASVLLSMSNWAHVNRHLL